MAEYRYDSSVGEVPPTIVDAPPPVDLSGQVATLQARVTALETIIAAAKAELDKA